MSSNLSEALVRAARRAAEQPFFLASVLTVYQATNQLDDDGLADLLGCQVGDLRRLALCRRPAADQAQFRADIDHLAQRFQLRGDQLAMIIRQVDALDAINKQLQVSNSGASILRAARDRDESAPTDEEGQRD